MKKLFAIVAMLGLFAFGTTQSIQAQDAQATEQTEQVDSAAVDSTASTAVAAEETTTAPIEEAETPSFHKELKTKFIEGDASFMSLVAIAMIIGLAFCIERIIYLNLTQVNTKKLMASIAEAIAAGDVEKAKAICNKTAGPVAAICFQGLLRTDQSLDSIEKAIVSYGSVQAMNLEKNCSWIVLFIAMAPSLGFLGTVIGMVMAFDEIQRVGDISPTVVAGGMKVALITTIYGIVVALVLQVFYNFVLTKIEAITQDMEDCSIKLLDMIVKKGLYKKD
jgi:biopolymer transport protein ExbB